MTPPVVHPQSLAARITAAEARLEAVEARLRLLEQTEPQPQPQPHIPTPTHLQGWRPVLHKPPDGCGNVALYLTRSYARTEMASLADMRVGPHLHPPKPGEPSVCASCGGPIDAFTNEDLDWSEALIDTMIDTIPPAQFSTDLNPTPTDPTGRLTTITDAIHRARAAGIPLPP